MAHGGGGGGPRLGGLPGGGVCGGGSGSVVHRGFYSQPLFWGYRGVRSSGDQFSTGPGDGTGRERNRVSEQTGSWLLITGSESKALTVAHEAPTICWVPFSSLPSPTLPHSLCSSCNGRLQFLPSTVLPQGSCTCGSHGTAPPFLSPPMNSGPCHNAPASEAALAIFSQAGAPSHPTPSRSHPIALRSGYFSFPPLS